MAKKLPSVNDKMYTGGTPYFDEKTGKYTGGPKAKKNPIDMTKLSKKFNEATSNVKQKNLKDFGLGTNDKYGVKEAQNRQNLHSNRAKEYKQAEIQNVWTQKASQRHKGQSKWAEKNKTYRQGYAQNNTDFAGMQDLTGYYNDTAGSYQGKKINKFGKKDMQYVSKLGVNDDVLKSHIGGLKANNIHENLRNHDYAAHIHKDGWTAGRHFNQSDKKYIKKNNLDMIDEIFKHAANNKGYSNMQKFGYNALKEAGRLKEYDALYAKGYDKDLGISSYDQGKNFNAQDINYLKRQGYSKREIAEHMGSLREGDDKAGVNYHAARWLNKNGMMDYYYGNKNVADYNEKKAKADAQAYKNIKVKQINRKKNSDNITANSNNVNVATDLTQTTGSHKDFTNDIMGNNNSNIGNDYSVNIASQGGDSGSGGGSGLNNMQDAMAFIGLNDNRAAKDNALFNPYDDVGLTMNAIDNAAGKDVDRRIYNSIGYDINYWEDKAKEQDNLAFGDLWGFQAPDYQMASSPSDPFKKVNS